MKTGSGHGAQGEPATRATTSARDETPAPGTALDVVDKGGYFEITGRHCTVTIEARPHYCDRGEWIAKLHPTDLLALEIDNQDGWPRYYFDFDRAVAEIAAWLTKRNQLP